MATHLQAQFISEETETRRGSDFPRVKQLGGRGMRTVLAICTRAGWRLAGGVEATFPTLVLRTDPLGIGIGG